MSPSKEELEALRRIEELLAQQQGAEPPAAEQALQSESFEPEVNPEAIQAAEQDATSPENQNETTNAILEQILVELQSLSNAIQELTS